MHEQTRRQQTSPLVKWLLNERAALTGRMEQLDEKLEGLNIQLKRADRRAQALAAKVSTYQRMRQDAESAHKALDAVMTTSFPTLNPAAGGVVRPWAGKYGAPGGLKRFVLSLLEQMSPTSIPTGDLARIAAAHFELQLDSREEQMALRKQVRRRLREASHLVEELPAKDSKGAVLWRWRGAPTLAVMKRQARETAHPFRPEVGGQRACGRDGRD